MDTVEEMGKKAYQKQIWGAYEDAIEIYNKAIRKFPSDPRLLNNRCCCYIEIKDYKRALEDAEGMITLFPKNKKSYYRKGEVLFSVKRYLEAEEAFQKVLTLDPTCEDARRQLIEVQTQQLLRPGKYNRKQAEQALELTNNNMEDAKRLLKFGALETYSGTMGDVFYSDEEDESTHVKNGHSAYDPLLDPANPLGISSLWVGYIADEITEKMLSDLFSKYGRIKSLHYRRENHYAFINYFDSVTAGKVMKSLQGYMLSNQKLLIKFPDNARNYNIIGINKIKNKIN